MKKTKNGFISPWAGSKRHERKWSDKDIEKMVSLRKEGLSFRKIGYKFNTSGASICSAIKRHAGYKESEELPPKGYITLQEYVEVNSISYNTAYYHIQQGSIKHVKYKNKIYVHQNAKTKERVIHSFKIAKIALLVGRKNLTYREVAKKLNISYGTVRTYSKLLELR